MVKRQPPETCPNCGADLPRNARACPECGSDETTGWSDEAYTSRLDLPDEDFDYEEFAKREFGPERELKPRGLSWFWWLAGVLVAGGFLFLVFCGLF